MLGVGYFFLRYPPVFDDDMMNTPDSHNNSDGQCYYFLMDYDLEYTDYLGTTKLLPRTGLPTRELIVRFIAIRASDHSHVSDISPISAGNSGGSHCEWLFRSDSLYAHSKLDHAPVADF